MAKSRKKSIQSNKSTRKGSSTPRSSSRNSRPGRARRIAGAVGRGLVPPGTLGMALGALGGLLVAPLVLNRLPLTQSPGWGRVAGRFAVGLAGYHLLNRVVKKPALAQGFYLANLSAAAGEGFNLARAKLSGVNGLGAGSMATRTGDVRFQSPGPALAGRGGVAQLAASDRDFVLSTDGRVLEVVNS